MEIPSVFVSHGAPDLPLHSGKTVDFFRGLSHHLPTPEAILVISAHWNAPAPTISTIPRQRAIYDFSGFPNSLYKLTYAPPGAPELAERIVELLQSAGLEGHLDFNRALDHGAWVPLLLAYPEAQIPVTQLSINYHRDPAYHLELGRAIAPLRQAGVLILASGSATHNLWALNSQYDAPPVEWAKQFDQWLIQTITTGNWDALLRYRELAPYARESHPSEEHFLPLFVALGAGGGLAGTLLHSSYTYGALSMASFAFQ